MQLKCSTLQYIIPFDIQIIQLLNQHSKITTTRNCNYALEVRKLLHSVIKKQNKPNK